MKKLLFSLLLGSSSVAFAASHSVTLTWTASTDSTTANPGTVNVLRATGNCPASGIGTLTYNTLTTTAPAGGPYVDNSVTSGTTYCYYVTATIGGQTSNPSNTFQSTIPVAPPSSLSGQVQ